MQVNELTTFVDLVGYEEKYQISNEYPYVVINKQTNRIVKESINNVGYIQIHINQKVFPKHRLIAMQFIENDDLLNKTVVDHINSNKLDNRIDNLQWISHSDNLRKRRTFTKQPSEYLPNDTDLRNYMPITEYKGCLFDRYYYDAVNERILLKTKSDRVKVIKPIKHNNLEIVALIPMGGRPITFGYIALMKALRNEYNKVEELDREFTEEEKPINRPKKEEAIVVDAFSQWYNHLDEQTKQMFTKEELREAINKPLNWIGQIIVDSIKQRNDS